MVKSTENEDDLVRVLCSKLVFTQSEPAFQWLIGSHFLPRLSILSTFRCIHTTANFYPDYIKESEDIRTLIPKGFEVVGALKSCCGDDVEATAREAIDAAFELRKLLNYDDGIKDQGTIGAVLIPGHNVIDFFVSTSENSSSIERRNFVDYNEHLLKSIWDEGCLLRCKMSIKLPVYMPPNNTSVAEKMYIRGVEYIIANFKDPNTVYLFSKSQKLSSEESISIIVRGQELDWNESSNIKFADPTINASSGDSEIICAYLCAQHRSLSAPISAESADLIPVSILHNTSNKFVKAMAPTAEYFPAIDEAELVIIDFNLDVLCYAAKELPLKYALSRLIIPGLVDQLNSIKKTIHPTILTKLPRLHFYHFNPPGLVHPVTATYELDYGETAQTQVEVRKSLHLRLGLPLDRPLLRIANAIEFSAVHNNAKTNGPSLLADVHNGIPNSGVSGGVISLIQGSYEYHHYLQDGFDDSGWGCAYRSLQTIISWFRLQHYTTIDVPSHRKIQEALVEIGDKEPSFIGSRAWIGAIELSFVLDKLLGVTCKIMNVRSGAELPEKCRELALHFENQGTPVMIGGGVLAYTLLGVDYNEVTGDCAFLILDPHYTGIEDPKKIVNGGWCGWKKAVDSKGKSFFLHDKFYNLLMPQRSNMI